MPEVRHMRLGHLTDDEYEIIAKEIDEQNDRGAAITAAAFVDEHLNVAIASRFVEISKSKSKSIFGGSGPLATFRAKTDIGFALGLYNEEIRSELERIGSIRNKFAHRMTPVAFTDSEIAELCKKLVLPASRKADLPDYNNSRAQYVYSCKLLMALILSEALAKPAPTLPGEKLKAAWLEAMDVHDDTPPEAQ